MLQSVSEFKIDVNAKEKKFKEEMAKHQKAFETIIKDVLLEKDKEPIDNQVIAAVTCCQTTLAENDDEDDKTREDMVMMEHLGPTPFRKNDDEEEGGPSQSTLQSKAS
ncbi:hypothetical protein R1flu_024749 [Riccia fluitans]|uniref:Uncharacterized protein n=1 Tax=Riccia fluitans TaxID=41844 RepID=A0ABD1XVT7_9MARC